MKLMKKLLLMLCLIFSAGAQSAWAQTWECWTSYTKDGITYNMNNLLEQGQNTIWSPLRATIASITATGDVTIPYRDDRYDYWVSDIGWDYESQAPVDINCTSYLTSLTINASKAPMGGEREIFTIHGTFSLENLYGPLAFRERSSSAEQHVVCTIIAQGAWIKIPHATSISYKNLQVDGFIEARSISSLTVPLCVSETGLIQAHTAKTVTVPQGTTIAGIVQAPKATKVVVSSNTSITETGQIIVDAPKNVEIKGGNFFGTLRCDSLTKITLGQVDFGISGKLRCPMLTDIYIPDKNKIPNFIGYYSERFTAPQNTITVHVYDMSPSEIASMKNSAVWNGFKEVVSHKSEVKATLSSNGGGEVQLWKKTGTKSQLEYTMSSDGGEQIVTLYDNADSYQIRLYYDNADYEKPVLFRNGTEVTTTDSGSGYCYYNDTDHMNVNRYSVSYNMKVFRKLHIVNLGNGIVNLTGLRDGVERSFTINGAMETYWGFDKTRYVGVEITPEEGYEVQKIKHYGYMPLSFSTNATTGVTTTRYYFDDNEPEQALHISYKKKVVPDNTRFNLHMAMEGALGAGAVFFTNDGSYDWADHSLEDNGFDYQMDPGESDDVIGIYVAADNPVMDFRVVNFLDEEDIAAGFTSTVKVYANSGEVASSGPSQWGGEYYSIPLDGTDTDVRVVFESNGRFIYGKNGDGGTVEIYCEDNDTPSSTTESGFWFYPLLPKTGNPYAVITPQGGKTVTSILRNGSLLAPSTYLQSDGTYRVPLEGFDRGDSFYEIYIIYSDDMAVVESTGITWTGTRMGDLLENANTFKAMLNDDNDNYRVFMQNQRYSTFNKKFDDDATSMKVILNVKDGYDFKVYFNGEEFPHTFTNTATSQDDISEYSFEATDIATIIPYLVDGIWTVEFKKAEVLKQSIQLTGGQLGTFLIQYLDEDGADYDDAQADNGQPYYTFTSDEKRNIKGLGIYVNVPQGYTFKAYFNGEEVTGFTLDGSNYTVTLDETFVTDGTWVVEFKKPAGITWSAVAMGAQNYLFSVQYDGDPVIPNLDSENHVSFSSGQVTPEQVQDISGLYVMAEPGYTFDLTFNGINLNGVFGEGTLRTINGKTYYEYQMTDAITDYKPILSTDGTWVVEFMKPDEVVAVLTPDRNDPLYLTDSSGEDVLSASLNTEIGTITKGGDYTIKVHNSNTHNWKTNLRVNGNNRTADLVTSSENANEQLLQLTNVTESLNVEAFFTPQRSNLSLYTTEGGTTMIEYTDNTTGETDSRTYSNGDFMNDLITNETDVVFTFTPEQGYKLSKVFARYDRWIGEGDDYEVKLQADGSYRFVLRSWDFINGEASITVHFEKKAAPEGITWEGMIIGDAPQGAVVDLGLDGMTMEVFLNAEETSSSDTYTGSTEGVGMNADITVPTGYNFKVWFNGEEKSTIFTYDHTMSNGKKVYIYNSNENSQNAPYLQDGQWIILFYDDMERYDVNRDGTISIADVTTLVNKILGKD